MTTEKGGKPLTYKPEYAVQAAKLCNLGATDAELADFFDKSRSTISRWKLEHPEFAEACNVGKGPADERVVRSLFHRAVGFTYTEQQAIKIKVGPHEERVEVVEVERYALADTTACIFWTKNRLGWRDKQEIDHSGLMTVNFTGADAQL